MQDFSSLQIYMVCKLKTILKFSWPRFFSLQAYNFNCFPNCSFPRYLHFTSLQVLRVTSFQNFHVHDICSLQVLQVYKFTKTFILGLTLERGGAVHLHRRFVEASQSTPSAKWQEFSFPSLPNSEGGEGQPPIFLWCLRRRKSTLHIQFFPFYCLFIRSL